MIEIHLDSFFIGVVIGFIFTAITLVGMFCTHYAFEEKDLMERILYYPPNQLCDFNQSESKKTMNGTIKEIGLPPIGSKGKDA